MRELIFDVNYCARGAKLWYGSCNANDVNVPYFIISPS